MKNQLHLILGIADHFSPWSGERVIRAALTEGFRGLLRVRPDMVRCGGHTAVTPESWQPLWNESPSNLAELRMNDLNFIGPS